MGKPTDRFKRDTDTIKLVGANIRKYRKLKGLKQKDLAYLCDLTVPMVTRYETGIVDLGITKIKLISTALDINPGQLFDPLEI